MKRTDLKSLKGDIKNILLIRRNNIGDMISVIPVFKTIRKEFPDARITVLADSTNAGIIEGASFIDDVLIYKRGAGIYKNKYLNYLGLFQRNNRRFDLAIALKRGFSSTTALITMLSGAGIRVGCMPEKWQPLQLCYNLPVYGCKKWSSINHVDAFIEFMKALGMQNPVKDISIEIPPGPKARAGDFLSGTGALPEKSTVVFNISSNKPENTWLPERFAELGGMLHQKYGAAIIITSTLSDVEKARALCGRIDGAAFYYQTPGVMDFAALVEQSYLLVCGEGGAMHIGASVGTPTISLWGSKRPRKWMPYGERQFVIIKDEHVNSISAEDVITLIGEKKLL